MPAQVEAGAQVVDVCMDDGLIDGPRGDADVPQPDGFGTRDRPRAGDDRLVEVGGTSSGT